MTAPCQKNPPRGIGTTGTQTQPGNEQQPGENPNADPWGSVSVALSRVVHEGERETHRQKMGTRKPGMNMVRE